MNSVYVIHPAVVHAHTKRRALPVEGVCKQLSLCSTLTTPYDAFSEWILKKTITHFCCKQMHDGETSLCPGGKLRPGDLGDWGWGGAESACWKGFSDIKARKLKKSSHFRQSLWKLTLGNLEFAGLLRMSRGEGRLLANSTNQQYCISITKMTGETPDVRSDKRKQREEREEREKQEIR